MSFTASDLVVETLEKAGVRRLYGAATSAVCAALARERP
jgi:hypothetical protein